MACFDSLWGFLIDPNAFSGIFELSAMLGMYVRVSDASVWLPSLTGWSMHGSAPGKFEFSDVFADIFELSAFLS